jgi:multiple sugar transport system substrate-binding protein
MVSDPWVSAFAKLDPEFQQITGAKVVVDAYGYDATHEKEVLLGSQKSGADDVIVLDAPWVGQFAEAGYVTPLKSFIDNTDPSLIQWNDYFRVFREIATWKGEVVGMPFGPYFALLNYRSDWFSSDGLQPPQTIAEFENDAAHFTNNPKHKGVYGAAMNNQQGSAVGQAWFEYIYNFGGRPFKSEYPGSPNPYADMTPEFNSPQSIAVVEFFKKMLAYEPPGALSMAWDERAQDFASGRVAMAMSWSVREPIFVDPSRSGVTGKFSTSFEPAVKGQKSVVPVGGWVMAISPYSKQKELAWDYIKWFTSPEVHKQFVEYGGPPSRYSEINNSLLQEQFPWFKTQSQVVDSAFADCRPRIPESFEIINDVGIGISKALTGGLSPQQAMDGVNQQVKALMTAHGYHMSD